LLLGEGKEEVRFFSALMQYLGILDIQVEEYGGKNNLRNFLRTPILGFDKIGSLGITRDADDDPNAAFQSVRDALNISNRVSPSVSGEFREGNPRVGIYIFPDGRSPGMLEDICLGAVLSTPEFRCVDEYLKCVRSVVARQPNNLSKARLSIWLASLEEPILRLGEAAERGIWQFGDPSFGGIIAFIRSL